MFTDTTNVLVLLLDLAVVSSIIFFLLRPLNSIRGWRYIGGLLLTLALLIVSDLAHLHGLHLAIQGLLIALVVGLPIIFHQEWTELLSRSNTVATPSLTPATVGSSVLIGAAIVFGLGIVLAANGVSTKTGELPDKINIKAVNLGDGLSANLGSEQKVSVIISAPRASWQALNSDSFSATVDVANQKEGTYDLDVHVDSKVTDVNVRQVIPGRVVVSVEPVIRKTVPVVVKFDGKAGNDLIPDTPTIDPDKVEITGAKSVVDDLTQVIAPVKLNGETGTLEQTSTLSVQNSSGEQIEGVGISSPTVKVKVALIKAGKIKTVGIKPVITGQAKAGLWAQSISVEPSVVSVTGAVDELEKLTAISTASINIDGRDGSYTVSVELSLPQGITIADNTGKVTVKITFAATDTTKTINPQLIYANLDSSLQVQSISPTSLSTVVTGSSDALGKLNAGSVSVSLDLSAYKSAGTYSITIKNASFSLPDGIGLVSFLPSVIDVTLAAK